MIGLSFAQWANADVYRSISNNKTTHYLGFSIGGGEVSRIAIHNNALKNKAGGGASFALHYEMQYRTWFFGLGLEGAYQHLHDQVFGFSDSLPRVDIDGDMLLYEYVHTAYQEKNHIASLRIPLYFGKNFGGVYTLLGVSFEIPIKAQYNVATTMFTRGTYPWSQVPIVSEGTNDFSSLGIYAQQDYTYIDEYEADVHIIPFIEVGYEFYRTDRVNMRVGAYAAYALPIVTGEKVPLADYSAIDINPRTQNLESLKQQIRWNPLVQSDKYPDTPYKLEVGVKLTMLFNVTVDNSTCMCIKQ